jgi:hypothetical protein
LDPRTSIVNSSNHKIYNFHIFADFTRINQFWEHRRQTCGDKIDGVRSDGVDSLVLDVLAIRIRQFEAGSEF